MHARQLVCTLAVNHETKQHQTVWPPLTASLKSKPNSVQCIVVAAITVRSAASWIRCSTASAALSTDQTNISTLKVSVTHSVSSMSRAGHQSML